MAEAAARLSLVETEAQKRDKDRFLCLLFAPPVRREALCGLLVVNQELASIPELVEEPLLRRMRLQWWRDELLGLLHGRTSAHPALARLGPALPAAGITEPMLERWLDVREGDLEFVQPSDLAALEAFGAETSGVVGELLVRLLGESSEVAFDAARLVGTAWTLVGLARSLPHHSRRGRCYLPRDLCGTWSVHPEDLFAGRRPAGLGRAVEVLILRARALLQESRALRKDIPRNAIPALLPAVLAEGYGRILRRCAYDPFASPTESPGVLDLVRLGLAGRLGRY